jgi:ATP-binding cassette subfamily B protein
MDHDVLRNVSFRLEKSTNTLLVGANGAGKTTLIRLLTRLYDPTEGHIRINGIDIRELEVEGLRRAVGVVFQDFTRFTLSAYENVGLGSVEELENKEEIVNSARRAKADEFIRRFPGGYETILSRTFTGGIELSGGQWQRISVARAYMKRAPILVFDEPASSLDTEAEYQLTQEIARLARDRVCLLISHRMFRPGIASPVVVLSQGRVIECGSHDELLTRPGEYRRLWSIYHRYAQKQATEAASEEP